MNESFNQSMSIKRVSKKIRKVKSKYINFCIFLLIINFFVFIVQKYPEFEIKEKNEILRKNIFLLLEDLSVKIIIIISLINNQTDLIMLFSLLYFIIDIIMIFYIILNKFSNHIPENQKFEDLTIIMFILNIILYCTEGIIMIVCSQYMRKEKREKIKEKYGFKAGNDMLRSKNVLEENSIE